MQPITRLLAGSIAISLLSACSSAPPDLYLIESAAERAYDAAEDPLLIGVGSVSLPSYANDVRIARKSEDGRIVLDDDHRWAEAPQNSIHRVFAAELGRRAGALVIAEPFPRGLDLDLRVSVTIENFIQTADDKAEMSGILAYQSGDGRSTVHIERFSFSTPLNGGSVSDYAQGIAANLGLVAGTVSDTISRRGLAE